MTDDVGKLAERIEQASRIDIAAANSDSRGPWRTWRGERTGLSETDKTTIVNALRSAETGRPNLSDFSDAELRAELQHRAIKQLGDQARALHDTSAALPKQNSAPSS